MIKTVKGPFLELYTTVTQLQPPKRRVLTGYLGSSSSEQPQNGVFSNTVKSESVTQKSVSVTQLYHDSIMIFIMIVLR